MTVVFDGKAFAQKKEEQLKKLVSTLAVRPAMATIIVGDDKPSRRYVQLKHDTAQRVGIEMDIYEYSAMILKRDLVSYIKRLDLDNSLFGTMIQLPLPARLEPHTEEIIGYIPPKRDVDGQRENSPYQAAVVRAIMAILGEAKKKVNLPHEPYAVVVGGKGEVGRKIVEALATAGYEVGVVSKEMDKTAAIKEASSADILISAVGKANVVTAEYVKKGAVVIDVGSPKGDVDFKEVSEKAAFITPVPGGVGPVTIISLLENLTEATQKMFLK